MWEMSCSISFTDKYLDYTNNLVYDLLETVNYCNHYLETEFN